MKTKLTKKRVYLRTYNYAVWAVELLCMDSRGNPDRWELWECHNTKREAQEWINRETSRWPNEKRRVILSKQFYRIRKFVPVKKGKGE